MKTLPHMTRNRASIRISVSGVLSFSTEGEMRRSIHSAFTMGDYYCAVCISIGRKVYQRLSQSVRMTRPCKASFFRCCNAQCGADSPVFNIAPAPAAIADGEPDQDIDRQLQNTGLLDSSWLLLAVVVRLCFLFFCILK